LEPLLCRGAQGFQLRGIEHQTSIRLLVAPTSLQVKEICLNVKTHLLYDSRQRTRSPTPVHATDGRKADKALIKEPVLAARLAQGAGHPFPLLLKLFTPLPFPVQ
jgi:hypothetical protein